MCSESVSMALLLNIRRRCASPLKMSEVVHGRRRLNVSSRPECRHCEVVHSVFRSMDLNARVTATLAHPGPGFGAHGERETQTYNGSLGQSPPAGFRGRVMVRGTLHDVNAFLHYHNLTGRPICPESPAVFCKTKKFGGRLRGRAMAPWIHR